MVTTNRLVAIIALLCAAGMAQAQDNGYRDVRLTAELSSKLPDGSQFCAINILDENRSMTAICRLRPPAQR
jgi:hypothetical protein